MLWAPLTGIPQMGLSCRMRKNSLLQKNIFKKEQNLYPISGIRFCPCRFYGRILMIVK